MTDAPYKFRENILNDYEPHDLYNLISTSRGPDQNDEAYEAFTRLKHHITGRIRHILMEAQSLDMPSVCEGTPMSEGAFKEFMWAVDSVKQVAVASGRLYRFARWLSHLSRAVGSSSTHPVWGGFALQIVIALDN